MVRPGYTFVDVGANAGYHPIPMAGLVGSGGHIYAFEPNDVVFPKLIRNIELNSELTSRVTCEKIGLGKESCELRVYQSGNELGNAYVSSEYNSKLWNSGGPNDYTACAIVPLDSYMNGRRVDLMKIDVEGMELDVFIGADKVLRHSMPIVLFETLLESFDNEKIRQTELFLRSHGYVLFGIRPDVGKLVPTTLPHLQEDTIAIHQTKIVEAAELMFNAAKFAAPTIAGEKDLRRVLQVIIVSDDERLLYIEVKLKDGSVRRWDSVSFDVATNSATCNGTGQQPGCAIEFYGDPVNAIRITGGAVLEHAERVELMGGRLALRS